MICWVVFGRSDNYTTSNDTLAIDERLFVRDVEVLKVGV